MIKDVLKVLDVNRETLKNWEANRYYPFVRHYPGIIKLLGYYPFDHEAATIGGKIKKYRYMHGLTQKQFAESIGVDTGTVRLWEINVRLPSSVYLEKVKRLF